MRHTTKLVLLAGQSLALAAPCAPQTDVAPASAPPLLRVEALGPAAWRARFLPTNLGTMLVSTGGEALWRPIAAGLDAAWSNAAGEGAKAARDRLLSFGGTVRVGIWAAAGDSRRFHGALVIEDRDASVVAALAVDLAGGMALLPERTERRFGDETWVVAHGSDIACTVPRTTDGRAVVLFAERERDIERAHAHVRAWIEAPPVAVSAPLRIAVDLAAALALQGDLKSEPVAAPLGVWSLGELVFTLTSEGPHLRGDLELSFRGGERGLFAGFFPERAGVPQLGDLVPDRVTGWKVGRFDPSAIWRAAIRVVAAHEVVTEETVLADARTECNGVDLGTEVFARLGDEVLATWHDEPTEAGSRVTLTLAMPVRESDAVRKALSGAIEGSGMETWEDDGVWHAREPRNWLFPALHLAVGRGLVCAAIGDEGGASIDAILARALTREPRSPAAERVRAERTPAGFNGVTRMRLDSLLRHHLEVVTELLGEVLPVDVPSAESLADDANAWLPLLAEHELLEVEALTGCAKARWNLRVLW